MREHPRSRRGVLAALVLIASLATDARPSLADEPRIVARAEPWRAGERVDPAKVELGQAVGLAVGTALGEIAIEAPWTDFRGQAIAPGRYELRYGLQPRLKEHAGADRIRDFALLVPLRLGVVPDSSEEWIEASRAVSRTAHPAVLALLAWKGAGTPPETPPDGPTRIDALTARWYRIDGLVVGFVVEGRAEVEDAL